MNMAFSAWAGWVGEEKNQRQFDQRVEDSRLFKAHSEEAKKIAFEEVRQLQEEKESSSQFCQLFGCFLFWFLNVLCRAYYDVCWSS